MIDIHEKDCKCECECAQLSPFRRVLWMFGLWKPKERYVSIREGPTPIDMSDALIRLGTLETPFTRMSDDN